MDIWNHNYAYHKWVVKKVGKRKKILDVGCGDGTLAGKIKNIDNDVTGIDSDNNIIKRARKEFKDIKFIKGDFLEYDFDCKYDAIIFVASMHHMDMAKALRKSKELLNEGGVLLVVGISKPSTILDWFRDAIRVIPNFIVSKVRHVTNSEELNIRTCYDYPYLGYVRKKCRKILKKQYRIKYGLYWRFLLRYKK